MEKKKKPANAQAQLAEMLKPFEERRAILEKERGEAVLLVAVPEDSEGNKWTACYISKPNRPTVSAAVSMMSKGQILESSEVVLRSAWIEGDMRILEEDDLFYAAHTTIQGLIEFRLGILKKN